jgi:hypothetical protein
MNPYIETQHFRIDFSGSNKNERGKKMKKHTPWGPSQNEEVLADGIISYSTASHGGIWLSPERQKALPDCRNWLGSKEWWEEDCDWSVPYLFFAEDIRIHGTAYRFEENLEAAKRTVTVHHPEFKAGRE